jgi:ribokinase
MDLMAECAVLPGPGETVFAQALHTICGGKGANQAVAAARLGATVAMIGRVGCDAFGATLREALAREGVDVSEVRSAEGVSGIALIGTGAGENMIMVASGANALLEPADIAAARSLLTGAAVALCQLESPVACLVALVEILAAGSTRLILDPAPAASVPEAVLARVDWLTPNEGEAASLLGRSDPIDDPAAAAMALRGLGVRNVALKLGARGVFLCGDDAGPILIPAPETVAVDSTAAGDTFNGAFGAALAEGADPQAAARFACRAAAISVSRYGAQSSMPSRSEVGDW